MPTSDCAKFCSKFPSPELVGFGVFEENGSIYCNCLYSGPNLPTPPAGTEIRVISNGLGSGPIQGSSGSLSVGDCYAFAQVREVYSFYSCP